MSQAIPKVQRWLEELIVGLNLCPFAAQPFREGRVRVTETLAIEIDDLVRDVLIELQHLVDQPVNKLSTTLIAAPAVPDYEHFLDAAGAVEHVIGLAGLEGMFQVVVFHPDAIYQDADPEDAANFAARAPVPVFHLIREDEMTVAIANHKDVAGIPDINAQLLREIGAEELARRFFG